MIKVIKFKKLKGGKKKYEITFEKNGKTYVRKFGAQGMSDFTIHKDRERRERYISRHKKDLRTNDPMKPGYLSMYILWNKPTLKASLADYKRRLGVYNRTGKFPKGITGSKKLAFGDIDIPFEQTSMRVLPGDVQNLIRNTTGASIIQDKAKKYNPLRSLKEALYIHGLKRYKAAANRTSRPKENMHFLNQLWTNLDPVNDFTAKWLTRASKVLTKKDIDFKTRNFWWKVIHNQLKSMSEIEEDGVPSEYLPTNQYIHFKKCQDAILIILDKVGYVASENNPSDEPGWEMTDAEAWWNSKRTNFGTSSLIPRPGTLFDSVPDDVFTEMLQKPRSATYIQKIIKGRNVRSEPKNMMTKRGLKQLLWRMNVEYKSPEYATEQMTSDYGEPWLVLNPARLSSSIWLYYAADILTAQDFKNDDLWYLCIEHIIDKFVVMNPDVNRYQGQVASNLTVSEENLEIILAKIGHYIDFDHPGWYNRALYWLKEEYATGNAFGKKYNVPDNVVNKKLYASIKAKIKRSIKGRRWGAYDSGRLVREYKAKGGKYRGSKGKTDLGRWYKEKWVDACAWPKRKPCGRKTKEKIAYCRPSKRIDSKTPKLVQKLTKAQIKSRCSKKKRSPMKRVTKFGSNQEVTDKMRQQMFNQIMSYNDPIAGLKNTIEKRCKRGFNDSFCQYIFTELLLSIYFTTLNNSKYISDKRKKNIIEMIEYMDEYIPKNFNATKLKIHRNQHIKVNELAYHLQDHTFGTHKNARIASLLYEYINVK